jgi:hypothetical protein
MNAPSAERRRLLLAWAFARLDVVAFAAASAAVFAAMLFALTFVLVLKGAPPGVRVGPHLAELAVYFPGYSVTLAGAFIGALYASLVGSVFGLVAATLWNFAHALLLGIIRIQANLASYSID